MTFYIRVFALCALSLFALSGANILQVQAATQEIVAVVNDAAISARDLNKRMKLIIISSGLPNNKETHKRVMPQVMSSLINEKIMLQEARKINIKIEKAEIESGLAKIAAQNNTTPDKFKAMLRKSGIDITTLYEQVEAQVAWSKFVQRRLRSKVIISDRDIEDVLQRTKSKIGTTEYLVAEIFLPVDDAKKESQVRKFAHRLSRDIKSGKANFFKLAQQFSKAAGAMNGGNKGWLHEAQVSEEILGGLKSIKKNQVSSPVKTLSGYHILFLRDTRILTESTMPSRDQIYYNLGAERLEKLQNRHLMDLKAASFIDVRI